MPLNVTPGYMKVIQPLKHASVSKNWSVTYSLKFDAGLTAQGQANAAFSAFTIAWTPLLDTNINQLPCSVYYQPLDAPLQLLIATGAAVPGGASRNSPTPQVATVIRKRTAFVGKGFRGRCFFPGLIDETNVGEDGIITNAGVIAIQARANVWQNGMSGVGSGTGPMYLEHEDTTKVPVQVTSLVVQPIVRTQRRRLPRG